MSEVMESLRRRLTDDFGGTGWEVLLVRELCELRRTKVADAVLGYCNYMKIHEINALIDEVEDICFKRQSLPPSEELSPKFVDTDELKSPPQLAAIAFEEERKKRGRPRVVKEVTRDNGEPDAPVLPEPKSSLEKFFEEEK